MPVALLFDALTTYDFRADGTGEAVWIRSDAAAREVARFVYERGAHNMLRNVRAKSGLASRRAVLAVVGMGSIGLVVVAAPAAQAAGGSTTR